MPNFAEYLLDDVNSTFYLLFMVFASYTVSGILSKIQLKVL